MFPAPCLFASQPAENPSMFAGILDAMAQGVSFATGSTQTRRKTEEEPSPEPDDCFSRMANLHECLDNRPAKCQQLFDDLISCKNKQRLDDPLQRKKPQRVFTR